VQGQRFSSSNHIRVELRVNQRNIGMKGIQFMAEAEAKAANPTKSKRAYHRKPAPPPPPEPPNPRIATLEDQILKLVDQRMSILTEITAANGALSAAQFRAQAARDGLVQLDQEVHYRMALIAQMKGQNQTVIHGPSEAAPVGLLTGFQPGSVGSVPAAAPALVFDGGRRVRSEAAIGVRDAEAAARAAI
jgi:hypothetical protein